MGDSIIRLTLCGISGFMIGGIMMGLWMGGSLRTDGLCMVRCVWGS